MLSQISAKEREEAETDSAMSSRKDDAMKGVSVPEFLSFP
jgi:hypothetical protein